MAPFSTTHAFANETRAAVFDGSDSQQFTSAMAPDQTFDLSVSAVEEEQSSDAGGANGSSGKDDKEGTSSDALYSLPEFMSSGVVNWGGYKFTYYSQQVLPGSGLEIPGRHVNDGGYVSDSDGYIVLAGSAPKGTVFDTPFGHKGKIYDRGTVGNHLDVYIR